MPLPGEPIPTEEEQSDEGGFEEEGHQPFDCQRGAEDIADVVRVVGPVGTELELKRDPGGDTKGEVDAEELAPETRHVLVDRLAGHDIDALHDDQNPGHSDR